jgi:competence protein ComGC
MRHALIATALLLALPSVLARAQPISDTDARAVRQVIEAQLDAFKRDDAQRAFSYATPSIRDTFGTAEKFMAMVREQYAVVYRPRSVSFEAPLMAGEDLVQPVHLTDGYGHAWMAIYPMVKQPDGTWRINGCHLARLPARET